MKRTVNAASKDAEVERMLSECEGSGIIYTATVKEAERLYEMLKDRVSGIGNSIGVGRVDGVVPRRARTGGRAAAQA